jgi:hypothetical protein
VIGQPAAGSTWTVTPAPGSVPVTQARHAAGLPVPSVSASVVRSRSGWVLDYAIAHDSGDRVQFTETGPSTRQVLGTVTAARGTLPFTPGPGKAGPRVIQAQVVSAAGTVLSLSPAASYDAPAAAPPGPPAVLLGHMSGTSVVVNWASGTGLAANGYVVEAKLSDGRRTQQTATGTSTVITGVYPGETGTIEVAALTGAGEPGAFATLTLPLTGPATAATGSSSGHAPWLLAAVAVAVLTAAAVGVINLRRRKTSRS